MLKCRHCGEVIMLYWEDVVKGYIHEQYIRPKQTTLQSRIQQLCKDCYNKQQQKEK